MIPRAGQFIPVTVRGLSRVAASTLGLFCLHKLPRLHLERQCGSGDAGDAGDGLGGDHSAIQLGPAQIDHERCDQRGYTDGDFVRLRAEGGRSGWIIGGCVTGADIEKTIAARIVRSPILASRGGAQFEADQERSHPADEFDDADEVGQHGHADHCVE